MNNKSEILANEIQEKEVAILQEKVEKNSTTINKLANALVADYCKLLDEDMRWMSAMLANLDNPPATEQLEGFLLRLNNDVYFGGEAQENLGIKSDVAKAVKQEKYNEVFRNLTKGTINDKCSRAELETQSEEITRIVYARAYKITQEKMDAAKEMISSVKKVLSRRMAEKELASMDDGRFTGRF